MWSPNYQLSRKNCLVIIELFADKFVPHIVNKMLHIRNDIYATANKLFLLKFAIFFVFTKANEVAGVCSFCWNITERHILWSLCSVDFHTLTLQLPIQTQHSVALELPSFCEFTQNFSKTSTSRSVLDSVKFSCFSPSRFSHFHCNTMRKAIKAHKNFAH